MSSGIRKKAKSDLDRLNVWKGERDTAERGSKQKAGGNVRFALSEKQNSEIKMDVGTYSKDNMAA
ncbi:hypothetical protein BZY71_23600 [Leclercia adecarboxylata]|nr:hypothetical protein BZY71_23600 [Leclercia adecarboxylata]